MPDTLDREAWVATEQWRAYVDMILRRDFRFDRWVWEGSDDHA